MLRNSPCKRSPRRFVRLMLEELEWRFVPSLMGVQIELPLSGIVSPLLVSVGTGSASTPAPTTISLLSLSSTSTPTTTSPATTTTSPTVETITISFTPAQGSNSSFSFTPAQSASSSLASASGSSAAASQPPSSASSASATGAGSASSSPAFSGGNQGSGTAFSIPGFAPAAFVPGLAIQASPASSSTILGGASEGVNVQLLGNLTWLQGPANVLQGTANSAVSPSSLAGAPLAGSLFGRPDLFTNPTTGRTTAFGLEHPAPGDREEVLPEQFLIPPDEQLFEPVAQNIEQTIPVGTQDNLPVSFLKIVPLQADPGNPQVSDDLIAQQPEGVMLSKEDVGLADDEEQPEEERSGMSAAVAIISFGAGAYWTIRDSRVRRTTAVLPAGEEAK